MTGPVEWSTLLWIVSGIGGAFVAGVVMMFRLVNWVQTAIKERDLALQVSDARAKLAEDTLRKEITSNELRAAQTYVTKDGLADALTGVQTSIDRLADLLNQLLVQAAGGGALQPPKRRSPTEQGR